MASPDRHGFSSSPPEVAKHPQPVNLLLLPWIEATCLLALAGLLLWTGIIPAWRALNTDFPNYYLVARLLREGYSLDRIYDWVWLQRIKDHWGLDQTLVGFAGLTPFSALPGVPLSIFPALIAKRLWILANVIFLIASLELLNQVTSLGRRRIWILCLLAIIPLRASFLFGQMHLLVLLLLVMGYFFYRKGSPIASGICLSIAGALKVYPLLLGVYFLWKRQWRATVSMLGAALAVVGMGYLWFGSSVLKIYATQILPRSLEGEVLDPYSARTASGAALFHRLFLFEPTLNPAPLFDSPSFYAVLYPLWQLAIFLPLLAVLRTRATGPRTTEPGTESLEWAAYVFALLLLSPVPSIYHFVVMVFCIVLLVDVLRVRKHYGAMALAIGLYYLISIIEFSPVSASIRFSFITVLAFARLWMELLFWILCIFCLWPDRATRQALWTDRRRIVLLCLVFAVVWMTGLIAYHRHFAYLRQDIQRRLPMPVPTFLAKDLHPSSGGYVFTAMLADGYRVLDQAGRKVWADERPDSADQLSVAAATGASMLMVEMADATGSRIATLASRMPLKDMEGAPMLIPDGESPAVSADGRSVAFIREWKGKGSLWLAHLEDEVWSSPIQVVGAPYEVRDVTFTRFGSLVFDAKHNGRISLFTLAPGSQPIVFWDPREDVESPAVSPDDRLVAFTKLVQNRWQLGYMDAATHQAKMLTFGDCNAYSPGWVGPSTIAYATDCGRGLGLTALARVVIDR